MAVAPGYGLTDSGPPIAPSVAAAIINVWYVLIAPMSIACVLVQPNRPE